jgi:hypothetical protein
MNREQIIYSMCMTFRHDYGLVKEGDPGGYSFPSLAGMTEAERKALWNTMAKIFDNDIAPHMSFKSNPLDHYWINQNQYSE